MNEGICYRKRIKCAWSAIEAHFRTGVSDPVTDNRQLLRRQYDIFRKRPPREHPADGCELTERFLTEEGRVLDEEKFRAFLKERARERELDYETVASLPDFFIYHALLRIGSICAGHRDASDLPKEPDILRAVNGIDRNALFAAAWSVEAVFSQAEPDYERYSDETKSAYRNALVRRAKRNKTAQLEEALSLAKKASQRGITVGELLFPNEGSVGGAVLWWSVLSLCVIGTAAFCLHRFGGWGLLAVLPSAEGFAVLCDRVASLFRHDPPALRLSLEEVPKRATTVVALTCLLSENEDQTEKLERFYFQNKSENLFFCLLADFAEANAKHLPEDDALSERCKKRIDALNGEHGNRFFLFCREREASDDGRFGGRERKRGAVDDLVRFLSGETVKTVHGAFPKDAKYLLTLDSDAEPSMGFVCEMLGVALHPVNRKYGVFQSAVQTELSSSYKTHFTRLVSGQSNVSFYEFAAFERNQSLYGEGIFCGKGLLDIRRFYEKALSLPDGKILSHDLPEGGLLKTKLITDIALSDSVPTNPASWYRRAHRWIRGDVQNLYFLFHPEYPLSAVAKRQILFNLLRHLTPIVSAIAFCVGAWKIRSETDALFWFFVCFSHLFLPFLFGTAADLAKGNALTLRHACTAGLSFFTEQLLRLGNELCSVCRNAFLSLDACTRSLWRMCVSGKHLLQWTTAQQGESGSQKLSVYLKNGLPGATVGCLLFLFGKASIFRLMGVFFFLDPMISYLLSLPLSKTNGDPTVCVSVSEKDVPYLQTHALAHWNFFSDTVNASTHFLPPDNLQVSPQSDEPLAMRTSPTNIGLYLLSVCSALDLHLIDPTEAASRLEHTLATVEGLDKVSGNLRNWYDLHTLAPLGDGFVSSVDSGNFVCCLVCLEQALKERQTEERRFLPLATQARRLADETDLKIFYDRKKQLFSLGQNGVTGKNEQGCYDLLMSEFRTSAYFAVASGQASAKHWYALDRTVTHRNGYIGMISWSGTMFEYFMPQLFLPIYRNSFLEETLRFALREQKKASGKHPYGVSESGYYAFDGGMHYRYHAHGIRSLALRTDVTGENVISPYATFLTLCLSPSGAVENLKKLESFGMFGKYGLYEALDRTPMRSKDGIRVQSYMAHHVGMSLLALDNALNERVWIKRFFSDKRMEAASTLLREKLPRHPICKAEADALIPKKENADPTYAHGVYAVRRNDPKAAMLCKGDLSVTVSSLGHCTVRKGDVLCNECDHDRFFLSKTLFAAFPNGKSVFGCSPFFGEGVYSFVEEEKSICLIAQSERFSGRVEFSLCRIADCVRIRTQAEGKEEREVLFAFSPMLSDEKSHDAHQAHSDLRTESLFDPTERILYFSKRNAKNGKKSVWLAVALEDEKVPFSFCTNTDGFPPESLVTPSDYLAPLDGKTGICVKPLCVLRTRPRGGGRATLLLSMGSSRDEVCASVRIARKEKGLFSGAVASETNRILGRILFPRGIAPGSGGHFRRDLLWRHGVSGDLPLFGGSVGVSETEKATSLLNAYRSLRDAGIKTELLLVPHGDGEYFRPAEKKLLALCESLSLADVLGTHGGIFLLRLSEHDPLREHLPRICADWKGEGISENGRVSEKERPLLRVCTEVQSGETQIERGLLSVCGGSADEAGFLREKHKPFPAVCSYVLAGAGCGSVLSASSLGYTFLSNAHEQRLTPCMQETAFLPDGEKLFLKREGTLYDLIACSEEAFFGVGYVRWSGRIDGAAYRVTCFCCAAKPFRVLNVQMSETLGELCYCIRPTLGSGAHPTPLLWKTFKQGLLRFASDPDNAFGNRIGLLYCAGASPLYGRSELYSGESDGFFDAVGLCTHAKNACFLLGGGSAEKEDELRAFLHAFSSEEEEKNAIAFAKRLFPPMHLQTGKTETDLFFNRFLPYQVGISRFYAKAGPKQSGGAFGFRDQLQDCLFLVYSVPETVREHLLRCCAHQYEEGDVLHWWHEGGKGIRSTCSDDLLWLPLAVADYVKKTGDESILSEMVPYRSSPVLGNEAERYEEPKQSYLSESVLLHCLRAFERAERVGTHGLLLMGCCDWNDAFSAVGKNGIGESVFSTLLYIVAVRAFVPLLEKDKPHSAFALSAKADAFLERIEQTAFAGDRYLRAFGDDGTVLGVEESDACKIDILTQAFALFAGADRKRCEIALTTAEKRLFDPEHRILRLFDPPFDEHTVYAGYINAYPSGVRENGGQYTHASVWGAMAFLRIGKTDTALALLSGMNPLLRDRTFKQALQYRSEPYAMCADIYSGTLAGRGGWSWYTGSAAWYGKVFLEEVLGIRLSESFRVLSVFPKIPYTLELRYHGSVRIICGANEQTTLDGVPISFPIRLDGKDHILRVHSEPNG